MQNEPDSATAESHISGAALHLAVALMFVVMGLMLAAAGIRPFAWLLWFFAGFNALLALIRACQIGPPAATWLLALGSITMLSAAAAALSR